MARLLDALIAWLMRPGVRRVRRWSFVVTLPAALIVGQLFGIKQGALVIAARAGLAVAVALAAWRIGAERGEALRDLLMHPRIRALARAELDVMTALPRLLLTGLRKQRQPGASYHRASFGFALGMAFTPMVLAEAAALHLLLGGSWVAWVTTALHAYSLIWLWGFAIGPRAFPHRIAEGAAAVLRNGPLYRVRVPLDAITAVTPATARVARNGICERDGAVLLAASNRVDVWLELAEPVRVQRPWREPLCTRRLAIASDDPERLVALLLGHETAADRVDRPPAARAIAALDVAGFVRDAAQPA